ncbi:MAG: glycosyltransferase [Acidisphaera sp.]|nr:glycosyltransferase [Acidisphaera sp.]
MSRLTVLSVAYPLAAAGPDAVGGSEQVLSALDRRLTAEGHKSIVVAPAGSEVMGELIGVPPLPSELDDAARAAAQGHFRAAIADTLRRRRVDLVHMHGLDFHTYLPPPGPPVLATLHLPADWYPPEALRPSRREVWLHGVSATQHADLERVASAERLLPPIGNGVPVEALGSVRLTRRGYALMLGRICPEKGQHLALEAAHRANVPLVIAGTVFPYASHLAYHETEVRPRLDRLRRDIGRAGFARKRRLLAGARCLLVPSLVAETSSLVSMEALAAGTPVVAFAAGALSEIIEPGRTGFLVRDVEEMAAAIRQVETIDPETCREAARRRFPLERSTGAYLALYRRLAGSAAAVA